ncbi:ArsR family transcriptional regulator [Porphyrobacter sp. YT40]|uniref:VpaChn25_0724 family phage protein n=1 Tax=Porphyrobacter sp. YT40 TaxID=2547601 RepID=UPI0015E8C0CA|nr:ArsR family transcriptional regulator [Porphyrobacter sp. YT40]
MSLAAAAAAKLLTIQRLAVLQLLADQPSGSANDASLCEALNALEHIVSRDRMRELLFWLQGQGAVHLLDRRMESGLVVATLTERGHDIARGRSRIAGVAAIDTGED